MRRSLFSVVPYVEQPRCDVRRGPRAYTKCELPPNHEDQHLGRSFTGKWFSWKNPQPMETCEMRRAREYGIEP